MSLGREVGAGWAQGTGAVGSVLDDEKGRLHRHSAEAIDSSQGVGVVFRVTRDVVDMGVSLLEVLIGGFDMSPKVVDMVAEG